ncbi:MAG: SIMPL domain-containing protein [Planctomycetota bacterium]|jgi:uncharacterized protein YggE
MPTPHRLPTLWAVLAVLVLLVPRAADAQMVGARAGAEWLQLGAAEATAALDHRAIENYITIEGKVEKRLDPTALRIVLAILVEQPTAPACQSECRKREEELVKALKGPGVDPDAIVVDFISILPVYEWEIEVREGESVAVEKRSGFRMQSNVHVEVATEEKAREALKTAFEIGVSDVIAFDYWNEDVDRCKKEARAEALQVAKEKAELLLGSLFADPPAPLNVHESTRVVYPRSLYHSFENVYAEEIAIPYSEEQIPTLRVARPKNTYYRGLMEEADVVGQGLPLRPQISVVSSVRLYYATPVFGKSNSKTDR